MNLPKAWETNKKCGKTYVIENKNILRNKLIPTSCLAHKMTPCLGNVFFVSLTFLTFNVYKVLYKGIIIIINLSTFEKESFTIDLSF